MATRYVGPGGNDGNSGLTWALRKLTLNGVEDTPVVAGDLVYVGPGVYRESLTVDVSGGAGTEIVYVADVTGENTDGVGGIVRITGSDNDQTTNRNRCIFIDAKNHRVFRGFKMDMAAQDAVYADTCEDLTFEDCCISETERNGIYFIANVLNMIIRRCLFGFCYTNHILFSAGVDRDDTNCLVENCLFLGSHANFVRHIKDDNIGGIVVRNCVFLGNYAAIQISTALAVGQTITVNNCIFQSARFALNATVVGEIVENFNTFYNNNVDRTNTNVGANSETYPMLLSMPLLFSGASQVSGFKFPWWHGELSEWSQVRAITGANEPTEDLRGIARPVTASKNSWGVAQFPDMERETGTVRTGSVSIALHDAGRHQIWVPVTATSTTIKIYVYREANYAGNLPQMIIKQPGVADRVTTDVGAAGGWNLLTDTFVPAAIPPYVVVELVSRNTAVAGNFETFYDDLDVS